MSLLRTRHYNFRLRELLISTFALTLIFVDCLTIEGARIERSRFVDLRSWLETLVAAVIAAAVAYLGYKLWLMGY